MKISDSTYLSLRRLHSLSGVVPIGIFLLEHFYTNSIALNGAGAFNRAAAAIRHLPFVTAMEVLLIGLPILFHMVLGVLIATTAQANVQRFSYARNWMYVAQRVSGVFLAFFIIFHVWATRLSPEALKGSRDLFAIMHKHLQHPAVLALYVVGTLAACFHLGNGLFGFAIRWGLATSRAAQRRAARVGFAVFAILAIVALDALLAFTDHPLRLLGHPPETTAMARGVLR